VELLRGQISQAATPHTVESPEFVSFAQSAYPNSIGTAFSPTTRCLTPKFVSVLEDAQQAFGAGVRNAIYGNNVQHL